MPDIRISVPESLPKPIAMRDVLVAANAVAYNAVGKKLKLKSQDFWTRGTIEEALEPVVTVNVYLVKRENRTPKIRKKLARALRTGIKLLLDQSGNTSAGVLVWIHKFKEEDFDEVEPS